ncbi:hypothetical protein EN792_042140, partial [Mesorhizobium sp. M00.F.Ca.ET.149.01.1.1]
DGSGWGAMVGVSAAYLARQGFSGAPALSFKPPGEFHDRRSRQHRRRPHRAHRRCRLSLCLQQSGPGG